jgi:hypothetical protein
MHSIRSLDAFLLGLTLASATATASVARAQTFSDNFNDNNPSPWWSVVGGIDSARVREVNGRVEFSSNASSSPASNFYVGLRARGWQILTDADVRARISFRFVKQTRAGASERNGIGFLVSTVGAEPAGNNLTEGVMVGIGQYLPGSSPNQVWREIDISSVSSGGGVSYLYSFLAPGNTFFDGSVPAFTLGDQGTIYVRYTAANDRMYFSLNGYYDPYAAVVTNATSGAHEPVFLSIGGLTASPRFQPGANSWMDNLVVDQGTVVRAPRSLAATDGTSAGHVQLTWTPGTSNVRYEIFRQESGGGWSVIGSVNGNAADEYLDTTAEPGVSYNYAIEGIARDNSRISGLNEDTGWRNLPAPSSFSATDGTREDAVIAVWAPVAGATGYEIRRKLGAAAPVLLAANHLGNTFEDTTAQTLKNYPYFVRAVHPAGLSPSGSNTGWRNRPGPATVTATDGTFENKVRVQWSAVPGALGYRVLRATSPLLGASFEPIATLPATATAFNDFTIPAGTPALYTVISKHALGWTLLGSVQDQGHRGTLLDGAMSPHEPLDADGDGAVDAQELNRWLDMILGTEAEVPIEETVGE